MNVALPLLLAPLLALAQQSVTYALVAPACASQRGAWLHAVSAAFVLATALLTLMAAREVQRTDDAVLATRGPDATFRRRHLVAWLATGIAALSTLVCLAMWWPQWLLSPCAD